MTSTPPATTDTPPSAPHRWVPPRRRPGAPGPAPAPAQVGRRRRRCRPGGCRRHRPGGHRPVLEPAELEHRRERQRLPDLVRHCPAGNAPRTDRAIGHLTYASTNNTSTTADVILPAGTATSTIQQEEQAVASARQNLSADEKALQSTEASNAETLSAAEQAVSQDEASLGWPTPPTCRASHKMRILWAQTGPASGSPRPATPKRSPKTGRRWARTRRR